MNEQWHLIIVGAGLAGLRVGIETLKKSPHIRCCILEKYDYVGGRVFTFHTHIPRIGKVHWESGAGRIYKHHKKVLSLMKSYNLHTIPISPKTNYLSTDLTDTENHFSDLISVYLDPLRKLDPSVIRMHTLKELLYKTIGEKAAKHFYLQFPYFSEIHSLRADVALQSFHTEMASNQGFFVCQEGLSSMTDCLHKEFLKLGGSIIYNTSLEKVTHGNHVEVLHCSTNEKSITYEAPVIVLALHHNALTKIEGIRRFPVLKHLDMQPLLRIYAIFPVKKGVCWFSDMPHTVTDSPIRYIIPIDPSRGIIMISYTDGNDAHYWIKQKEKEIVVMKEIRRLFPEMAIPDPLYFKTHPWYQGCTYWLPGAYDVKEASEESLHPLPTVFPGLFLCGESFAENQCWMESALDQADKLLKHPSFLHLL